MSQYSKTNSFSSGGRRLAKPREERRRGTGLSSGATAGLYARNLAPQPPPVTSRDSMQEHAVEDRLRRTAKRRAAIPAWPAVTWYQAILWNLKRARRRWRHILREKQDSHFPESNRLPIQVLLLIWGILPMWGSLLEEHIWGRRKRAISRNTSREERSGHRVLYALVFLGGTACIALVALFFSTYTYGTTVSYDGEVIAAMSSRSADEVVPGAGHRPHPGGELHHRRFPDPILLRPAAPAGSGGAGGLRRGPL